MVDIARDPRWGRIVEGAGEDPYLGSVMARAYVRGYQGKSLRDKESVAACVKHFVGYGAAEAGRDYNTAEISEHTLREVYFPPFYAALSEGSVSLMSSFNTPQWITGDSESFTLTQILRKEWGFPGLVVSDWTSVGELVPHGIALDGATAARKAITAGVDMDMVSDSYHQHLADLVKSGKVSQTRLDEAVRNVLRVKFALGLFEDPFTDESREIQGALPKERVDAARLGAERSFVLLKNSGAGSRPILPLAGDPGTIAVIGPLADDANSMLWPVVRARETGRCGHAEKRAGPESWRGKNSLCQGCGVSNCQRRANTESGRGRPRSRRSCSGFGRGGRRAIRGGDFAGVSEFARAPGGIAGESHGDWETRGVAAF